MDMPALMSLLNTYFLGWPLIIFTFAIGTICTLALRGVQFRYFFSAWKYIFVPEKLEKKADVTPLQAFFNTLSSNLGNGSIAGMASAIYSGGPGAAFWMVVIGLIMMSVRFVEVFLSIHFGSLKTHQHGLGGPMLYLRSVTGGVVLAYVYAVGVFFFSLVSGDATQTNTIASSLAKTWGVPLYVSAVLCLVFILYILTGGAQRIARASEAIVPLKVVVFFSSSIIVLCYHYAAIIPALQLIFKGAFEPAALAGGALGFTIQRAMQSGMTRGIFANESGLGTAAVMFSATGSHSPVKDALMSMISTFISIVVCFMISLSIVASGVWNNGLNGSELTISAYQTVFGAAGGWIVSFLTISFGIGVLVSFAYVARESWLFLTGGRWAWMVTVLYGLFAFGAPLVTVNAIWDLNEIFTGVILAINLFGIISLLPLAVKQLKAFQTGHAK